MMPYMQALEFDSERDEKVIAEGAPAEFAIVVSTAKDTIEIDLKIWAMQVDGDLVRFTRR